MFIFFIFSEFTAHSLASLVLAEMPPLSEWEHYENAASRLKNGSCRRMDPPKVFESRCRAVG